MAHGQKITEADACTYLAGFRFIDPHGQPVAEVPVTGGSCFRLQTPAGEAVYVVRLVGSRLWVSAAAGKTVASICPALALMLQEHARQCGALSVGFQTARRGLVRRAQAQGFKVIKIIKAGALVTGYVMEGATHEIH